MPPDFLNSREDALLLWTLLILGYLVYKDPRGMGALAWHSICAFMIPKLAWLVGLAALYSAGLVLLAERIGLWHTTALKETVYWFIGSAVILTGKAVNAAPSWGYLKTVARHAVNLAIIISSLGWQRSMARPSSALGGPACCAPGSQGPVVCTVACHRSSPSGT